MIEIDHWVMENGLAQVWRIRKIQAWSDPDIMDLARPDPGLTRPKENVQNDEKSRYPENLCNTLPIVGFLKTLKPLVSVNIMLSPTTYKIIFRVFSIFHIFLLTFWKTVSTQNPGNPWKSIHFMENLKIHEISTFFEQNQEKIWKFGKKYEKKSFVFWKKYFCQ